jgi:YidC/Oxa1 family membrane protein insertase
VTELGVCLRLSWQYCQLAIFALFLVLLGIRPANAGIDEATVEINNPSLKIVFDAKSSQLTSWRIKDIFHLDTIETPVIRDLANHADNYVSLNGIINGKELDEWAVRWGGWQLAHHTSTSVVFELSSPDGQFALRQHWLLSEVSPWQATYQIEFERLAVNGYEDTLWLEIGPGVGEFPKAGLGLADSLYSFTNVVHSNRKEGVSSIRLNSPNSTSESSALGDWVGLQSRYFAFIVAPSEGNAKTLSQTWLALTPPAGTDNIPAGFDQMIRINLTFPGQDTLSTWTWSFYGGGKAFSTLAGAQPNLSDLLYSESWGWMRVLTLGLMHVLVAIQNIIGNWGLAIIFLAVMVRIALHPLAKRALASQKRFIALQEKIKPQLVEIKSKYKGGEQSERILRLYEKNQTNPFAGLKPLLIVLLQLPIFVALYHLLGQLFELRDEAFLWIATLAEPDKLFSLGVDLPLFGPYFNLLPTLLALSTIASIKLSPAPAPASDTESSVRQNIFLVFVTLVFFLLFYSFPSGIVLYWTAANLLHLAHVLYVQKRNAYVDSP